MKHLKYSNSKYMVDINEKTEIVTISELFGTKSIKLEIDLHISEGQLSNLYIVMTNERVLDFDYLAKLKFEESIDGMNDYLDYCIDLYYDEHWTLFEHIQTVAMPHNKNDFYNLLSSKFDRDVIEAIWVYHESTNEYVDLQACLEMCLIRIDNPIAFKNVYHAMSQEDKLDFYSGDNWMLIEAS